MLVGEDYRREVEGDEMTGLFTLGGFLALFAAYLCSQHEWKWAAVTFAASSLVHCLNACFLKQRLQAKEAE
jgi:hypothetical protein